MINQAVHKNIKAYNFQNILMLIYIISVITIINQYFSKFMLTFLLIQDTIDLSKNTVHKILRKGGTVHQKHNLTLQKILVKGTDSKQIGERLCKFRAEEQLQYSDMFPVQ